MARERSLSRATRFKCWVLGHRGDLFDWLPTMVGYTCLRCGRHVKGALER